MNNKRRSDLRNIIGILENVDRFLDYVLSEETDYRDNIPENLQGSDRSERSSAAIESMEAAIEANEKTKGLIEEAIEA